MCSTPSGKQNSCFPGTPVPIGLQSISHLPLHPCLCLQAGKYLYPRLWRCFLAGYCCWRSTLPEQAQRCVLLHQAPTLLCPGEVGMSSLLGKLCPYGARIIHPAGKKASFGKKVLCLRGRGNMRGSEVVKDLFLDEEDWKYRSLLWKEQTLGFLHPKVIVASGLSVFLSYLVSCKDFWV